MLYINNAWLLNVNCLIIVIIVVVAVVGKNNADKI